MREAREEIGLELSLDDVTILGRRFVRAQPSDNEVQDVFAVRADLPLGAFTPHPLEVDALLRLPIADAIALLERRGRLGRGARARAGRDRGADRSCSLPTRSCPRRRRTTRSRCSRFARVVAGEPVERFLLR